MATLPDFGLGGVSVTDDLTIVTTAGQIAGWEEIEVTLRADSFPNSFAISMSARDGIPANAGDDCSILLGGDHVITGYIDRVTEEGDAHSHRIELIGRGKTQDLVDCSAELQGAQHFNGTALDIATQLATPYSIAVELGQGAEPGPAVPQFNLNFGETAAEIIQRVARNAGLIVYEDARGHLILAKAGTIQAASGAAYGQNVQAFRVETGMDGRYSEVACTLLGMDSLQDIPGGNFFHIEPDPNVRRHRQLDLVAGDVATDASAFVVKRAQWEVARRAGLSTPVQATVDGWRDSAGTLWTPNTLVPVDLPRAGQSLVLSAVTFHKSNGGGTTADLTLLPVTAFSVEPVNLQPVNLNGLL